MRNNLIYGEVSANDYGVYLGGDGIYNVPERTVETVSVPGRNGDLTIDQKRYENVPIQYYCFVDGATQDEMRKKFTAFKNAIASQVGYKKLIDTYQPDDYRMALFVSGIEVQSVALGKAVVFQLQFNCKPQRYLTDGDNEVTITDGSTLNNPTLYDAEPLLMVEGYGDIGFNGYTVNIEDAPMGEVLLMNKGTMALSFATSSDRSFPRTFNNEVLNDGDPFSGTMSVTVKCENTFGLITFFEVINDDENTTYTVKPYTSPNGGMVATITMPFSFGAWHNDTELSWSNSVQIRNKNDSTDVALSFIMSVTYSNDTLKFAIDSFTTKDYMFNLSAVVDYGDVTGISSQSLLGNPTYIDCEIGEAYKYENGSLIGLNSYIDLGSDLPKLSSGINTFEVDETITSLIVVPRFWQL